MPGFFSFTHGFGSPSRFIIVIDSTPPPMAASACPMTIWWAALAMACSPDEQKRVTVAHPLLRRDRPDAAAEGRVALPHDDLVGRHRDGLQPRGAEAVDRRARDRD